jgi:hypothetical protein
LLATAHQACNLQLFFGDKPAIFHSKQLESGVMTAILMSPVANQSVSANVSNMQHERIRSTGHSQNDAVSDGATVWHRGPSLFVWISAGLLLCFRCVRNCREECLECKSTSARIGSSSHSEQSIHCGMVSDKQMFGRGQLQVVQQPRGHRQALG